MLQNQWTSIKTYKTKFSNHQMLQNQWKNIKSIKNWIPKPSHVTKQMEQHKTHNLQTINCCKKPRERHKNIKTHNLTIRILAVACGHGLVLCFLCFLCFSIGFVTFDGLKIKFFFMFFMPFHWVCSIWWFGNYGFYAFPLVL